MEYDTSASLSDGHGGGDFHLVESFINAVNHGDFENVIQNTQEALQSHLLAFSAEDSRLQGKVLDWSAWQ
jgi:hypothetical protein